MSKRVLVVAASSCTHSALRQLNMSRGITTKPPNVLVLCGGQKSKGSQQNESIFSAVRETLVSSLDTERYVVYPLALEDASRVPWRDNCRLLVVSCGLQLRDYDVLRELESYVKNGGTLLSTHPHTNAAFGFRLVPEKLSGLVEITGATPEIQPNEWIVARTSAPCPSVETLPDALPILSQLMSSRALARMREVRLNVADGTEEKGEDEIEKGGGGGEEGKEDLETSSLVDCIQHVVFEGMGQVVLSHVDILSSGVPEETTASVSELVALKRDAQRVSSLFQSVLKEIGMECSKGERVAPTLSYLVCSDQV